jgi:hypothetical protein
MKYNICSKCKRVIPAHKGHTKTFNQLEDSEKNNSIKAMTFNLKRAIINRKGKLDLLWAINYLSKR